MTDRLDADSALAALADAANRRPLAAIGEPDSAPTTAGVYALWHENELLYVGMVRVSRGEVANPRADGVRGRLKTYFNARLTSDFVIAVTMRFIVPTLTNNEIADLATGAMTVGDLHDRVRRWIAANVSYSCASTDQAIADGTERQARREGLDTAPPSFNALA